MTAEEIKITPLEKLIEAGGFDCSCGRRHTAGTGHVFIGKGAVERLTELLDEYGAKKVFLLSGRDTFKAAGERVCGIIKGSGADLLSYVFPDSPVAPAEKAVGSAVMHFDNSCDAVVAVGSGVINDIGKILAAMSGKRYIIVGTAPSMDGFASSTSSMERDGLKVSLNSTFADAVIGDTDILKAAPMKLLISGVGDMIAKYISLAEWRIASVITGEYYCETIAALVEAALEKVISAAPMLVKRDEQAVASVMEGMVTAGLAMKYAGLSRPASGMEHYFSHIWDMRSLAFKSARADLHGIQCGIATLYSLKIYDYIRTLTPDREKALEYAKNFDLPGWESKLRAFIGGGAEAMIALEHREGKYDRIKHAQRLDVILEKWEEIIAIIDTLPEYDDVFALMNEIGAPTSAEELEYSAEDIRATFMMTKDIRDKYIASRLLWDLGELENAATVL